MGKNKRVRKIVGIFGENKLLLKEKHGFSGMIGHLGEKIGLELNLFESFDGKKLMEFFGKKRKKEIAKKF